MLQWLVVRAYCMALWGGCPTQVVRWQALKWSGPTGFSSGVSCAQMAFARGHLLRKTHPEGGLIALGMSPVRTVLFRVRPGSGTGIAERSASVYG